MDVFFVYMIFKKKINFKCLVSLVPFFLLLIPHLIWLSDNNYTTITYASQRTGVADHNFINHLRQIINKWEMLFSIRQEEAAAVRFI